MHGLSSHPIQQPRHRLQLDSALLRPSMPSDIDSKHGKHPAGTRTAWRFLQLSFSWTTSALAKL